MTPDFLTVTIARDIAEEESEVTYDALSEEILDLREEVAGLRREVQVLKRGMLVEIERLRELLQLV